MIRGLLSKVELTKNLGKISLAKILEKMQFTTQT